MLNSSPQLGFNRTSCELITYKKLHSLQRKLGKLQCFTFDVIYQKILMIVEMINTPDVYKSENSVTNRNSIVFKCHTVYFDCFLFNF